MDFTTSSVADVCRRLAGGEGVPGAYTPASLFGPELVSELGGTFTEFGSAAPTN